MASKQTKMNDKKTSKASPKKQVEQSNSDTSDSETDIKVKPVPKNAKKASPKPVVSESNSDSESTNNDDKVKPVPKNAKKASPKPVDSDSDAESTNNDKVKPVLKGKKASPKAVVEEKQPISDSDVNNDSESEEDDPKYNKKPVEKKVKETYLEITTRISTLFAKKKDHAKVISSAKDTLNKLYKEDVEIDKELYKLNTLLPKSHTDEVTLAVKNKSKRKGNGGFKPKPVPEVLLNYFVENGLNKEECTVLDRPGVFKRLNQIFVSKGLRTGKDINLDKETCQDLKLDVTQMKIEFNGLHPFIATFYKE